MSNGCILNYEDEWKPCSAFPEVQNDILLYLLLMGGKHHPAFRLKSQEVPYSHFLMQVTDNADCRSHILDLKNAVQKSNDGMFLESLLCSTICLASHSNGVAGLGLNQFLLNLVYQLQIKNIDRNQITIENLELLNGISFTVPFLSPANQKWPNDLQIPDSNMGSLDRCKNEDMIDLRTSCGLFGEAKDYKGEIKLKTMRRILERIPEEAIVELVFTRKLQDSYFNAPAKSFDIEFQRTHPHLLERAYYKINSSMPKTQLESINGLPSDKLPARGVVIFIVINEYISL